ncbi:traB domain-containing protein-like isoform X2 [Gigantopelta aegis]|uniref:traB domain-containing protein-like isoform X2 n=1 Tax=Gigantopelta aegis TaxID=1735272 RepID=UPI001B8895E7|nr:traB domain-containing protein-like isoform X2 [Gigantopelta aegis]
MSYQVPVLDKSGSTPDNVCKVDGVVNKDDPTEISRLLVSEGVADKEDLKSSDNMSENKQNTNANYTASLSVENNVQNNNMSSLKVDVDSTELQDFLSDDDLEDEQVGDNDSGDESDIEDNDELALPIRRRESNPVLPDTVSLLESPCGSKVYLVGTAHFSLESQEDVAKMIQAVQPDFVMVELCKSRINILELDESTLLEEAKNINFEKVRMAIRQSGVVQGVMHLLLLSMSAHLTKELGMAPGGEFRRAFQEARLVPGCRLQLGDRPIQITLKRALAALSWWQKVRLGWYLIMSKDPISKEDVEKCKQRDLLEAMLKEMTGEFPALSHVFVDERDVYLAHSLKVAARPLFCPDAPEGVIPSVVVGVVGIGHVPGIVANWSKEQSIEDIMIVPGPSLFSKIIRWTFRVSVLGIVSWGCYRIYRFTSLLVF